MKKLIVLIVAVALGYGIVQQQDFSLSAPAPSADGNRVLVDAQAIFDSLQLDFQSR